MSLDPFDQGFFFFIAIIKLCYAFMFIYLLYLVIVTVKQE